MAGRSRKSGIASRPISSAAGGVFFVRSAKILPHKVRMSLPFGAVAKRLKLTSAHYKAPTASKSRQVGTAVNVYRPWHCFRLRRSADDGPNCEVSAEQRASGRPREAEKPHRTSPGANHNPHVGGSSPSSGMAAQARGVLRTTPTLGKPRTPSDGS